MSIDNIQLSKFLSYVLRHKPDAIGLTLDSQGWASIDELITKADAAGTKFDQIALLRVVETSDKKRFSVSPDGLRIRAAQGHSVSVELGLSARQPPPVLYHGTATRFVDSILAQGLRPQARQHVHLSLDEATALRVGERHGKAYIFRVDALAMHAKGFIFYLSDNGVWLTDRVRPNSCCLRRALKIVPQRRRNLRELYSAASLAPPPLFFLGAFAFFSTGSRNLPV